ncbi:uncharacterized protein GGS25DRAFT_523415 [Hypoxylon fragiforme]|uniref:uncharacterized protein n=1 Tax=Hypoxylon fragiforme TaxID=63214 RepID=UPI0020C6A199|nr:uncharacterized protein GGS25DRAFT_523415 [Hypoxylon fragiforme]KAI2605745.1 hypothetical protein GGS25DRAFT_523415 [Hypoxylon fragiforme]
MAPRRLGGRSNKGFLSSTYETFTSSENASVVRSVAIFGAAVTFLASPWSEYLLPPTPSLKDRWNTELEEDLYDTRSVVPVIP